jgi:hypothetical protein
MGVTGVEKSHLASHLCCYYITLFWCFLAPSSTHLGGCQRAEGKISGEGPGGGGGLAKIVDTVFDAQ